MKRVAVISTVYAHLKHTQHFIDRLLVGYPYEGEWIRPDVKVVSLYVDQRTEGDQSQDRAREFGFGIYPTIPEALRCGGDSLAVDGVLIIGEHGEYPSNEKGQKLYPRHAFFKQCVEVFETDGRAVPVYNDKHLSYSWTKAEEMVADSKRLGFPMLAGSSLPVTWRLPDLELESGCVIEEAMMIGVGGGGCHGLPLSGGDAVHGRAPAGRRDRCEVRSAYRGGGRLACRPRGCMVGGVVGRCALPM